MDQTQAKSGPKDINHYLTEFDKVCTEYLVTKAPFSIPDKWRDILVTVMAYLNVIGIVLAVPALLALVGLGAVLAPIAALSGAGLNPLSSIMGILGLVFTLGSLVLSILAAPGLFKKQKKAWTYSYYNVLLGAVGNIVQLNLGGLIIGSLIGLYVLYQIRPKFVN